jgi:hypothetical protein
MPARVPISARRCRVRRKETLLDRPEQALGAGRVASYCVAGASRWSIGLVTK